jgi:hypothetical protein
MNEYEGLDRGVARGGVLGCRFAGRMGCAGTRIAGAGKRAGKKDAFTRAGDAPWRDPWGERL